MRRIGFLLAGALVLCPALLASVTVIPATPASGQPVLIRVDNFFLGPAHIASESITRTGNAFVITQNISVACGPPGGFPLASQFSVGPLPPGSYTVTANITFNVINPVPGCAFPPVTQTATFDVAPDIPTLDPRALAVLAIALALVALRTRTPA